MVQQEQSKSSSSLAVIPLLLGVGILASLMAHILGYRHLLTTPGAFLFSSFLWTSLFVPLYLLILSFALLSRPFQKRSLILLNLFILPFATASVFQKVVLSSGIPPSLLPELLINRLGKIPAALLLFLLLLVELLVILRISARGQRGALPEVGTGSVAANKAVPFQASPPLRRSDFGIEEAAWEQPDSLAAVPVEAESISAEPLEAELLEEIESAEDALVESEPRQPVPVKTANAARKQGELDFAKAPKPGSADLVATRKTSRSRAYVFPVKGLLKDYEDGEYWKIDAQTRRSAETLMDSLEEFNIQAEVTGIRKGPVITMFEILPAPGVKISKIVNLADNIALRLAASRVRIVAPIPGKHAVGIEVPNRKRAIVSFKEMVVLDEFQKSKFEIPISLGKDIAGDAQIVDLTQMPHLLIAGATGSGKSVCVNSIICSILYSKSPEDVRFLLIDPKIVELKTYNDIPHLLTPVITNPKNTFQALQYCLIEMERRYSLLDALGVRDIRSYNKKASKQKLTIPKLPYWVVVIDEFADLMATSGKEMESTLARLAAMCRAIGIHLVLATQRPSIEVITGLIKANIPTRIAFMVASKFDSRIIIDSVGAEKLLGQGDMLFSAAWDPLPVRMQGAFLSDEEVEAVTDHARSMGEPDYLDEEIFFEDEEGAIVAEGAEDPMMEKALEIILVAGKASASYLQRRLKIGYNRAARLIEDMEMRGIVGPPNGSKPREILHVPDRG